MGRDSGGAVRDCTRKKILSSSGERRIRRAKRRIVLDVFLTRGPTWKHIQEMRERWGIEAQAQMPPPYQGSEYVQEPLQSRPEEEFGEQERFVDGYAERNPGMVDQSDAEIARELLKMVRRSIERHVEP